MLAAVSCLGCWEEVHFQLDETPPTMQGVAAPVETPSVEVSPVTDEPEVVAAVAEPEVLPVTPPVTDEVVVKEGNNTQPEQPEEVEQLPEGDPPGLVVDEAAEEEDPFGSLFSDEPVDDDETVASSELPEAETVIVATESVTPELPAPTRTALATWQMSSKWSMAVALQAKGRNEDSYGERLEQAKYGAKLLEVSLPELLTFEADADRLSANLMYLLEEAGPRLAEALNKQHGADHAALAELATKTHVLLLSYTPESTRLEPVIAAIRKAAVDSRLPESVWRELIELLETRAEFVKVKAAVFELHKRAAVFLSGLD